MIFSLISLSSVSMDLDSMFVIFDLLERSLSSLSKSHFFFQIPTPINRLIDQILKHRKKA